MGARSRGSFPSVLRGSDGALKLFDTLLKSVQRSQGHCHYYAPLHAIGRGRCPGRDGPRFLATTNRGAPAISRRRSMGAGRERLWRRAEEALHRPEHDHAFGVNRI